MTQAGGDEPFNDCEPQASRPLGAEVLRAVEAGGFTVVDQVVIPAQAAALHDPPALEPRVRAAVVERFPGGIYSHQAQALRSLGQGEDVCLSTPTASGKSLVFVARAADILLRDPNARVIAFYPAKALIQDQLDKWTAFLNPLGLEVGHIDGSVATDARPGILKRCRVLLMTPDVAHAWLMSKLELPEVRNLLSKLRLLILDEAHVYEGVFGTNMAYFLRRFQVVAAKHQLVCATATLADEEKFIERLTGRTVRVFGEASNGAPRSERVVVSLRPAPESRFAGIVGMVRELSASYPHRFLVFADSRKTVEMVVAALGGEAEVPADDEPLSGSDAVLPYRSGYEDVDREQIQRALQAGRLKGVVSTSALELGLDIGEIELVVLLGVPASMKSFWQRAGRAGRRGSGTCLMVDEGDDISVYGGSLSRFLERPNEPSWLYLDNRFIQYAHALCMASESKAWAGSRHEASALAGLPGGFRELFENEISQTERIASDLYVIKQRAQEDPHHAFPLRSGIETTFTVEGHGLRLGSLTFSQVLREAYPGAVYHYMARPYRIGSVELKRQRITAKREKRGVTTRPNAQTKVFPGFDAVYRLWRSSAGFLAEAPMQVSERVIGFYEIRGQQQIDVRYGPTSGYARRELNRFFETTGVCWSVGVPEAETEPVAAAILDAFARTFGVQKSDLGVGQFFAKQSPIGTGTTRGVCVYDAAHGSLRLTERLAGELPLVLENAIAQAEEDEGLAQSLRALAAALQGAVEVSVGSMAGLHIAPGDADVVEVIAEGESAFCVTASETREVKVIGWRYTPHGLMYQIGGQDGVKEQVPVASVQPIRGETRMVWVNLTTGEPVERK